MSLSGGFANAPIDVARSFRAVLKAMSRPGLRVALRADLAPPRPLSPETAALLLTLTDADTPVWLAAELATPDVCGWLAFHAGAQVVPAAASAMFAVATQASDQAYLISLAIGTAEYPDRAATVLLQLPSLGEADTLCLTGPGIETEASLDEAGLPPEIVAMLMRNADLYPLGLDVVLTAPGAVLGLPRSTRLGRKEPH
jgi:alpha-D-ribose 1-methylphosphonate 5-triphosphate synthase subunit PhnH